MMIKLQRRAEALARAEQRRAIGRIVEELKIRLQGAAIEDSETKVEIRGKGLVRRWLRDAGLRFVGSLVR